MRDILTVVAGLLILVLAAALAVPPLVDWEAQRGRIDRAITRAVGVEAATEGRISVRLLPSPRIRVDHLRLGGASPETPSFSAGYVKAEIALTPLLRGEIRFTEARVGRAEIRIPAGPDGAWHLPAGFDAAGARRSWAFEDVSVSQLLITTVQPATGRTDQLTAEGVRLEAQSLAGPWRIEGASAGVPFRLSTGELGAEGVLPVKLVGGGDAYPRFDFDARLALGRGGPSAAGTAKIVFGPPAQAATGFPLPVSLQSAFKASGPAIELESVALEAGEGGALRLAGSGRVRLDEPRIALRLEARRLDLDAFFLSATGQDLLSHVGAFSLPVLTTPVDLDLAVNSVGFGRDEIADVALRASLVRGRLQAERLAAVAPGQTRVSLQGEFGPAAEAGASGRFTLVSAASDRFARYLDGLGLRAPVGALLDGRPLEAAADAVLAGRVVSLRNVRVRAGEARLTGNARYTAADGASRGRLEAQIGLQAIDLAALPQASGLFEGARSTDLDLILDARDVRHGERSGAGRIAARIAVDGQALVVDTLEIADLAGANAEVAGRIGADGAGRIAGRITAKRAAPLVDLLGTVWAGGTTRLVPAFLREGALDLALTAERAAPGARSPAPRLRTAVRGTAAGGLLEAELVSAEGITETVSVRLATDHAGRWLQRPDAAALRRPATLDLKGGRDGSGQSEFTVSGDVAGVAITTARPFGLGRGGDAVERGEAELATPDLTPFLVLLGEGATMAGPVPARLRAALGRERDAASLTVSGQIAGDALEARFALPSRGDISGTVSLERLSLPWLAGALALNAPAEPRGGPGWSAARFGESRPLLEGGQARLKVRRLDLGRGLAAEDASFALALMPDGIGIREFDAGFAGGRLLGALGITRQGSRASLIGEGSIRDATLSDIAGATPFAGRVTASARFGSAGESIAAIVANLSGTGDARIDNVVAPDADPAAIDRALPRVLASGDPLVAGRLDRAIAEELGRGPFRAATAAGPLTLVGGAARISPATADAGPAGWQGSAAVDFKVMSLDVRGVLRTKDAPRGWTGPPPVIGLGWRGPIAAPVREIETGALTSGIAAIVLRQELDKIEAFEAEANERARLNARREFERARREAAEAARLARMREQQAEPDRTRLRLDNTGSTTSLPGLPPLPPPLEVQPAPRVRPSVPGG